MIKDHTTVSIRRPEPDGSSLAKLIPPVQEQAKRPPRYPKHAPETPPRMHMGGQDLGVAMSPTDVFMEIRLGARLQDLEIIEAFLHGADRVEADLNKDDQKAAALSLLSKQERLYEIARAREVTVSRIEAWRRRHRRMTWPEIRILLIGLRDAF